VMGIIGTAVSLGLAVGHPLGGLLVGTVGWRAIFWVNLPVCLLSWYMVLRYVPGDHHSGRGERFDLAGALLLFSALICYALAMTLGQHHGFSSGASPLLFAAAAVGVALFLWVQARSAQPMMPLSLFRDPEYALGLVMGWNSFLILGGMFILPIYLQAAEGYTPQQAGFLMLVVPVCMGIVSHPAGWCADRFGPRLVSLAGLVLLVLGCLTISGVTLHVSVSEYVLRVLPLGLGLGLFQVPNNSSIMGRSPRNRLGVSSGLVALSRTLGNTSGVPLMGAVFSVYLLAAAPGLDPENLMAASPQALVAGLDGVFGVAAWLGSSSIVVGLAAWWLERRRRGEAPAAETGR
jgi:MFS family permease